MWQPIETVPDDIDEIIGYDDTLNRPVFCWRGLAGWFFSSGADYGIAHLTHWMPLPNKPEGV